MDLENSQGCSPLESREREVVVCSKVRGDDLLESGRDVLLEEGGEGDRERGYG